MSLSSARDFLKIVNEMFPKNYHFLTVTDDKLILQVDNGQNIRSFMLDEKDLQRNLWDVLGDINFLLRNKI